MNALVLFAVLCLDSVQVPCTGDIWVYPHASDGARDAILRVWGSDGNSVAATQDQEGAFSYGYLAFPLPAQTGKLTGASLVLHLAANPVITSKESRESPLEARALSQAFDEETWDFSLTSKIRPVAGEPFGSGAMTSPPTPDRPIRLEINLVEGKGEFTKAFEAAAASTSRKVFFALTSRLSAEGRRAYRVISRESPQSELRPTLVLTFENGSGRTAAATRSR